MLLNLVALAAVISFPPPPLPPLEQRVDGVVAITKYTYPDVIDKMCGGKEGDDRVIIACSRVGGPQMVMPHPCLFPNENYARLLCHELGHISGWPADHPNPQSD